MPTFDPNATDAITVLGVLVKITAAQAFALGQLSLGLPPADHDVTRELEALGLVRLDASGRASLTSLGYAVVRAFSMGGKA